jgi:hypothetical protein
MSNDMQEIVQELVDDVAKNQSLYAPEARVYYILWNGKLMEFNRSSWRTKAPCTCALYDYIQRHISKFYYDRGQRAYNDSYRNLAKIIANQLIKQGVIEIVEVELK